MDRTLAIAWPILLLFAAEVLALTSRGEAAESGSHGIVRSQAYHVVQTITLKPEGVRFQVLEDARITPEMRKEMWGNIDHPFEIDGEDLLIKREFRARSALAAKLRLLDNKGQIWSEVMTLGWPLARIEKERAGNAILFTYDASIGRGSFSGPRTLLYQVRFPNLELVKAVDDRGNRRPILVIDALRSAWRIQSRGASTEVLEIVCSHDAERGDDAWKLTYRTFRLEKGIWHLSRRQEPGFWERGHDFPERSKFP